MPIIENIRNTAAGVSFVVKSCIQLASAISRNKTLRRIVYILFFGSLVLGVLYAFSRVKNVEKENASLKDQLAAKIEEEERRKAEAAMQNTTDQNSAPQQQQAEQHSGSYIDYFTSFVPFFSEGVSKYFGYVVSSQVSSTDNTNSNGFSEWYDTVSSNFFTKLQYTSSEETEQTFSRVDLVSDFLNENAHIFASIFAASSVLAFTLYTLRQFIIPKIRKTLADIEQSTLFVISQARSAHETSSLVLKDLANTIDVLRNHQMWSVVTLCQSPHCKLQLRNTIDQLEATLGLWVKAQLCEFYATAKTIIDAEATERSLLQRLVCMMSSHDFVQSQQKIITSETESRAEHCSHEFLEFHEFFFDAIANFFILQTTLLGQQVFAAKVELLSVETQLAERRAFNAICAVLNTPMQYLFQLQQNYQQLFTTHTVLVLFGHGIHNDESFVKCHSLQLSRMGLADKEVEQVRKVIDSEKERILIEAQPHVSVSARPTPRGRVVARPRNSGSSVMIVPNIVQEPSFNSSAQSHALRNHNLPQEDNRYSAMPSTNNDENSQNNMTTFSSFS